MAESKGCAKALRRVTRGGADSTSSPGRAPSNMRDCVATKMNLTQSAERTQSALRRIGAHKEMQKYGAPRRVPLKKRRANSWQPRVWQRGRPDSLGNRRADPAGA